MMSKKRFLKKRLKRVLKMEQKEHKEIAEIINSISVKCMHIEDLTKKLADYFERKDKQYTGQFAGEKPPAGFNRKQFLKDCGVQ